MQVKYITKSSFDDVSFAILVPDNTNKKLVLEIAIHGMGERSSGTLENLENLVLGQKQPDGSRRWPFVFEDMNKAVDQYGIVMVIPTYSNFMEPAMINKVYDYCKTNYNIYDRMILTGFSLGGGAVVKYLSSSLANAQRVAYAVPCAATNSIISSGAAFAGQAGVSVHLASNDNDPTVNVSNTKSLLTSINAANPPLKAVMTIFDREGHGSNEKMWALAAPKAPGGQGLIDAAENIYQAGTDCVINGPRQMKSGAVVVPQPQPTPSPTPTLSAAFNIADGQVVSATVLEMDASASTGVKQGWDGYAWDVRVVKATSGNICYDVRPETGMYGGPKKNLTGIVDGEYSITLTVKDDAGNTASKTIRIIANLTGVKVVAAFDSKTDLITYSDGTTEAGEAIFGGGKWVVKSASGKAYSL